MDRFWKSDAKGHFFFYSQALLQEQITKPLSVDLGYFLVYDVDFYDNLTVTTHRSNATDEGLFTLQQIGVDRIRKFLDCSSGLVSRSKYVIPYDHKSKYFFIFFKLSLSAGKVTFFSLVMFTYCFFYLRPTRIPFRFRKL